MTPKMAKSKRRGPKPEHLAIEGDWELAVSKALAKEMPAGGWPKRANKKPKKRGK